ncbi:MAG: hypothetical protein ACFE96_13510, partial [Candidatus Hermodarchaeota archaeon]
MIGAEVIIYIMGTCLILMNLTIGIFLLIRTRKTGLSNFYWLSFYFFCTVLEFILRMIYVTRRPPVGVNLNSLIYFILNLSGHTSLIIFVKYTFYTERKSAFPFVFGSTMIARIFYVISYIITDLAVFNEIYMFVKCLATYIIFITSFWLSYASLSTYSKIKRSKISPWIKKRYLMVGISAIFLIAQSIPNILMPYRGSFESPLMATLTIIITFFNFLFAILSLMAWVMPKRLKLFLNHGYSRSEDEELS